MAATLHLICGLPGSGKTTFAKTLAADLGALRLEPDEWLRDLGFDLQDDEARGRVDALQRKIALRALRTGQSVVMENGFWLKSEREALRAEAASIPAETRLHYMRADLSELKRRVARRNAERAPRDVVDLGELDDWAAAFEPPGEDERPSTHAL